MPAPSASLAARHARLRTGLAEHGVAALIVSHLPNIHYLTNFTGSAAVVLVSMTDLAFITDFRYVAEVEAMPQGDGCPGLRLLPVTDTYPETLLTALEPFAGMRVGFEAAHTTVAEHGWLLEMLGRRPDRPTLVPTERLVEAGRMVKDSWEQQRLRTAGYMLTAVVARVLPELRAGLQERDVAAAIDYELKKAGFSRPAFETIVASGPNAGLPHARPGDRALAGGDLVVLDFGGVYDGYCVDLTRTVSVGPPSAEQRRLYDAVREAHAAALAAARPGMLCSDVDAAARDVLTRQGLGERFGHGTGHGLGLEVHEEPRVGKRRAETAGTAKDPQVVAGMVFTIEPGAYLPGWGGVRIEDDVLVTAGGAELLTDAPRELIQL